MSAPAPADCAAAAPGSPVNPSSPRCGVCLDALGTSGGPASLPCGHNGCLDCLNQALLGQRKGGERSAQPQQIPQCPFCRQAYTAGVPLGQNRELKETLDLLHAARDSAARKQHELDCLQQEQEHLRQQLMAAPASPPAGNKDFPFAKSPSAAGGARPQVNALGPSSAGPCGNEALGRPAGQGVLRGMLSLVRRSKARDQFWNSAAAPGTVPSFEGVDACSDSCGAGSDPLYSLDQLADDSHSLAPPLSYAPGPHHLQHLYENDLSLLHQQLMAGGASARRDVMGLGPGEEGFSAVQRVMEAEPPTWVPDSASTSCMRCAGIFRPVICMRHHCRFCGHLVCDACSRGRALLPKLFRESEPQRVCDGCYEVLLPVQRMLVATVAPAGQVAVHDVTDLSSWRAWVNSPWGLTMGDEIFKATNMLRSYAKVGRLNPERAIPGVVLGGARGLALLTAAKVGAGVTYKVGSGVVLSRRPDGSWSAPTAIAAFGFGWGAQIGGEIVDLIVVLRSVEAVKAFCGDYHVAVGASVGAAAGPLGRTLEADVRAGRQGLTTAYTYSCAKGAYVGISWEYSLIAACHNTNIRFYGSRDCRPADILFGNFPQPVAAAPLYAALDDLFRGVEYQQLHLQHLEQQQREQTHPGYAVEPELGACSPGDVMDAAEGVLGTPAGPSMPAHSSARVSVKEDSARGGAGGYTFDHTQQQQQQHSASKHVRLEDGLLDPPPPPYDSCYPLRSTPAASAPPLDDDGDEWPSDALPMMP